MDRMNIGQSSSEHDIIIGNNVARTKYVAHTHTIQSLHQLRPPVADFVGRQGEIDHLVHVLGEATISGIRGLGGTGKTQLALAVAQRLKGTFPDAQLLLELRGSRSNPLTPEQALQTIIRAFEPLARLPDNLDRLRSAYLNLLNDRRVLILADDALDARQVELLQPPPGCALLLTSRHRFSLPGMATLDLDILPQSEAEKLLVEICPRIGPAAPRMAQLCARLTLALRLCASMCANSILSIEHHIRALEDERERLLRLGDPDASVEASLQLSYSALDRQMQEVLCQLSVFPSSFDIIAARAVVHEKGAGAEGQRTNGDQRSVEELLDLLYSRSLVEWDRQTGRYSLHDLVSVFASERLEAEDAVRLRHAQYYALIAAGADELYKQGGENVLLGLKLFDMERANIDAGWNWAREQAEEQPESMSQEIGEILLAYANATIYVGDLRYDKRRERIPQLEAALEAARRLSHKEAEGGTLGNLGLAYADLGEPRKAIQYHEQHLKIARLIGDRWSEGSALGNLGNVYAALGEPREAIQYYEQSLVIAHEIGDRQRQGNALGNLGNAYVDLGEPRKAIQYYEQHLEIAHDIGDRRGEGGTLGNLGLAYAALGEPRKAIQNHEQQREIARQIGDRRSEAIASWNLGRLLAQEGDLARAVELLQVLVDYEHEIGHADAEKHAAAVEELRKALA